MTAVPPLKSNTVEEYEEPVDPNVDEIQVRGVHVQGTSGIDAAVKLGRNASDHLTLTDAHAGTVPLPGIRHAVARAQHVNLVRTAGRLTDVNTYKDAGETILIGDAVITRTAGRISQVVEKQRDEAGVVTRTLTTLLMRTAGRLTDVDTTETP